MGMVMPLIIFGIGIMSFGFYWRFFDDILTNHIQQYVLVNDYYIFTDAFWNWLPWIFIIVGIISLIAAGVMHRNVVIQNE